MLSLVFVVMWASFTVVSGLAAYDCSRPVAGMTTISIGEVEACNIETNEPQVDYVYVQLLQQTDYHTTMVNLCRIKVEQHISYCGMYSHVSEVEGGETTFSVRVGGDTCSDLVRFGQMKYASVIIDGLIANATNRRTITIAGSINDEGTCEGTTFSSNGREYKSVFVMAKLEITIRQLQVSVNHAKNEIILPSGTRCVYSDGHCQDSEAHYTYWEPKPRSTCRFEEYTILYEGISAKVSDNTTKMPEVYFGNSTGQVRFALTKTGDEELCGYKLIKTDQAKLYIMETVRGRSFTDKHDLEVPDILLTMYFNTKLANLGHHIERQLKTLYQDILMHRCLLERQVILNSIPYVYTHPDLFALEIMKEPGYLAIPAGEVAHLIQCQLTNCTYRKTQECFLEMPAICEGNIVFIKARSRIITRVGTPRECSSLLPSMFNINGGGYSTRLVYRKRKRHKSYNHQISQHGICLASWKC